MQRHVPLATLGPVPTDSSSAPVGCCPTARSMKNRNIHLNPVRAGLVKRAEDWLWSSALDHGGSLNAAVTANRIPAIDRRLWAGR